MRRRRNTATGTKRMRQLGYKRIELWLSPHEVAKLEKMEWGWRRSLAGKCRGLLSDAIANRKVG